MFKAGNEKVSTTERPGTHTSDAEWSKVEFANQAFKTFGVGESVNPKYKVSVEAFLKNAESRSEALARIAELCSGSNSPKALWVKAMAFLYAGAKYRKQTIESILEYLRGDVWDELPSGKIFFDGIWQDQRESGIAEMWRYLGDAYLGEKDCENALNAYAESKKVDPYFLGIEFSIAKTYAKMGFPEKAVAILEVAKKNKLLKSRKYTDEWGDKRKTLDFTGMYDNDIIKYKEAIKPQHIYCQKMKKGD